MWPFNRKEKRDITRGSFGAPTFKEIETHAGVEVSQNAALRVTTANRCIRLISESIAGLPADAFRRDGEARQPVARPPLWLETPNPETTWFEFMERITESLALDGNAFIIITARDLNGHPSELWTLHPGEVTVHQSPEIMQREGVGSVFFRWADDRVFRKFTALQPFGDVLHIRLASAGGLRGLSPVAMARQALGLALVTEKFGARFFSRGQQLSGVIELPATEPAKSRQHIDLMRESWLKEHSGSDKAHTPGILTGGAAWKQMSISPEDAQFLETRKFQVEEIARLYGVPPHMVGATEKNTSWGSGIEQLSLGFARFTLLPWLVRIEHAFSQLLPRGQFFKFNQRGLLRADAVAEAEAFSKAIQVGWMTRNEARALQEMAPMLGLDRAMVPLNQQILDESGEPIQQEAPEPESEVPVND